MNKTSEQLSWGVLVKLAAVDPTIAAHIKRVADRLGYTMPGKKELEKMFPTGWEKESPGWQAQFEKSEWLKNKNSAKAGFDDRPKWTGIPSSWDTSKRMPLSVSLGMLAAGITAPIFAGKLSKELLDADAKNLTGQQKSKVYSPVTTGSIVGSVLGGAASLFHPYLRSSSVIGPIGIGSALGMLGGLPFAKRRLNKFKEEQEDKWIRESDQQEEDTEMRKASSEIIGKALYRSSGPTILNDLLSAARERYKNAQAVGEGAGPAPTAGTPMVSPIDEQHKQNLNAQELQFAQEEHQLQLEKMQQEIAQKQQAFEMKQMQMAQQQAAAQQQQEMQQQSAMGPQIPPEQQAAMQAEQYRQNMMVSQNAPQAQQAQQAQPANGPVPPGPAASGMGPGSGPGMGSGMGY